MKKDLNSKGNLKPLALFLSGGALFSMHFGASSMVWPMNWGKESGTSFLAAFIGAFITALLLVVVGYIALARGEGTYKTLAIRISGKKFAVFFTCLTIAVNGPLYVIPRMSAAAWDSLVQAFGLTVNSRLPLIIFTIVFYIITYLFLVSPGKAMDRISSILFPVLLIIVVAVVGKGLLNPLGEMQPKLYEGSALAYGFTGGYATGEILCALIFGAVIINSLKNKGVEEKDITRNMIMVGVAGVSMLTITHFCHMVIGATSASTFPSLNYTALYTAVAASQYGKVGGMLFCAALFMAALTTAIGMTSGCAEFFVDVTDRKFSYNQVALVIVILSIVFGSMGLADILTYLGPIMDGVYPAVIVLVLYYGLVKNWKNPRLMNAARWAFYCAFVMGMMDMLWKYFVKFNVLEGLCSLYLRLPMAGISLAWMPWTAAAFVIGLLTAKKA
jgi:LIVCS family branched-chain amino acid:cation transporter